MNYAVRPRRITREIADVIDWSGLVCESDVLRALECARALGCSWIAFGGVTGPCWTQCGECGRPTQDAKTSYVAWDGEVKRSQVAARCHDCAQMAKFGLVRLHLRPVRGMAMFADSVTPTRFDESQVAIVGSAAHLNMVRHLRDDNPVTADLSPDGLHHAFETCERLGEKYMELARLLQGVTATGELPNFWAEHPVQTHYGFEARDSLQVEFPDGARGPIGVPAFLVHADSTRPECYGRAIDGATGQCPGCGVIPERHMAMYRGAGEVR